MTDWLTKGSVAAWVSFLGGLCSLIGLIPLFLIVLRYRRDRHPIEIVVKHGEAVEADGVTLAYRPLRKDVTRAELIGILGTFHGEGRMESFDFISVL